MGCLPGARSRRAEMAEAVAAVLKVLRGSTAFALTPTANQSTFSVNDLPELACFPGPSRYGHRRSSFIVGSNMGKRTRHRLMSADIPNLLKSPGYHHDGGGLYLQVGASGSASWVLRYTIQYKTREMGLGSQASWSLAEARKRAEKLRQLISDGIDPISRREDERKARTDAEAAKAKRKLFRECVLEFHKHRSLGWRNAKHSAQFLTTLQSYANPVLGELWVSDITPDLVARAVEPLWQSKLETAQRLRSRIRMVLVWSVAKGYRGPISSDFWDTVKASLVHLGARKQAHFAKCEHQAAGGLLHRVLTSDASETVKLAFMFTVLTAARSGETRGATWDEIDLLNQVWKIPGERMKAHAEHQVPLSSQAVEILRRARRLNEDSPVVFPGRFGKPLSDMAFTQLLRRLEAGCTMHGFRSTFRDWVSEETDFEGAVAEKALAHKIPDKVEAAYRRGALLKKRQTLMQAWADFLELEVGKAAAVWSQG